MPRLCPCPARESHCTDATSITKPGVTIQKVPDRNGT